MIVHIEGRTINIREPQPATLKKYGISLNEWKEMLALQGYRCPICKRPLEKPCVDHLHIRNWKRMKPEKRKLYIRGIPCIYCNRRRLAKGMDLSISRNMVEYFEQFEKRRPK